MFRVSRILRSLVHPSDIQYLEDAATQMVTYKSQPEFIGSRIKYLNRYEGVYVTNHHLLGEIETSLGKSDGCNMHFPKDRVIRTRDDVNHLVSDVTYGRYMLCNGCDDGIFVYYIPDSLIDEYSALVEDHRVILVSKKIHIADKLPECPEIVSRDDLRRILKKYE